MVFPSTAKCDAPSNYGKSLKLDVLMFEFRENLDENEKTCLPPVSSFSVLNAKVFRLLRFQLHIVFITKNCDHSDTRCLVI